MNIIENSQNRIYKYDTAVSIVIPLYNEEANISAQVEELRNCLIPSLQQFEILLIDDGSSDQTAEIIDSLSTKLADTTAIHHADNYGQSRAIHTGATAAQFSWVISIDGDRQYDPADILKLISTLEEYSQVNPQIEKVVIMGKRLYRQDSFFKRLSSKLANNIRQWILKDYNHDTGCSLKLFRREDFLQLPYFDHMHRFLPALFQRQGTHMISLGVNHRARQAGISKYGFWNRFGVGIIDLFGVFWLIKRYRQAEIRGISETKEE